MTAYARIRTPRLRLVPPSEADPEAIAAGIGNYDVARWLGRVPYPYRIEDARQFLQDCAGKEGRTWYVTDETGLCGGISIDGELGYWLAREAWGLGYATEACDAVVDAHFADPGAGDLVSGYFLGNDRSAGVLRKVGFVPAGTSEIHARALAQRIARQDMVLTRDRWRSRRDITVVTPRLLLRVPTDADIPAIRRTAGDPEVARMLRSIALPLDEERVRALLLRGRFVGRPGYGVVIERTDGVTPRTVIGMIGIRPDATIGFHLDRRHWRMGLATEAASAFLEDVGRRFRALSAVTADQFADNPAAGRVLEKLGFARIGTGRTHSAARKARVATVLWRRALRGGP